MPRLSLPWPLVWLNVANTRIGINNIISRMSVMLLDSNGDFALLFFCYLMFVCERVQSNSKCIQFVLQHPRAYFLSK